MAREIAIILRARDDASKAIGEVTRSIQGMKAPLGAVAGVASALGLISLGRHLVDGLQESTKKAAEAQVVDAQLAQALRNSGQSVEEQLPLLQARATALQAQTGVDDEAIKTGQTLLITLGRLSGEGLDRATRASLDLGAVTGDTDGAFKALAKAAAGNFTPLQKMGIVLGENVPKADKFGVALDLLGKKFGGQAVAAAQTFTGQMQIIGTEFQELQEALGKKIIESPAIQAILEAVTGGIRDLHSEIESADIENAIKAISINVLDFAEAAVSGARAAASLGGSVAVMFEALRGGDTAATREMFEKLDDSLGGLLIRIDTLQGRLGGVAGPAGVAADGLGRTTTASHAALVEMTSLRESITPANAILGLLAVTAGSKVVAAVTRMTASLYASAAGLSTQAAALTANIPLMAALENLTLRTSAAMLGVAAATLGAAYALTRMALNVTGLDDRLKEFFDHVARNGADSRDTMQALAQDVALIERQAAKLAALGFQLDLSSLNEAREALKNFEQATGAGKARIALDAGPLLAELDTITQKNRELLVAARDLTPAFSEAARSIVGPFRSATEQLDAFLARIAQTKDTKVLGGAAEEARSLAEILKSLNIKSIEQLRTDARELEIAYAAVQAQFAAGLIPPERAAAVLAKLVEDGQRLSDEGIRVNFIVGGAGGLDAALKKLKLDPLKLDVDTSALRIAIEQVNALDLQGPKTEQAQKNIDAVRASLFALAAPIAGFDIPGLDVAAERALRLDAALESVGGEKLGASRKEVEKLQAVLAELVGRRYALDLGVDATDVETEITALVAKIKALDPTISIGIQFEVPLSKLDLTEWNEEVIAKGQEQADALLAINSALHEQLVASGLATSEQLLGAELARITAEEEALADAADAALAAIEGNSEAEIAAKQDLEDKLTEIHNQGTERRKKVTEDEARQKRIMHAQAAASIIGSFAQIVGASGRNFRVTQALRYTEAVVSTYAAANQALATPPGPPYTIPNMWAAIAIGLANVATIRAQKPAFAKGGVFDSAMAAIVPGVDTGRDDVNARLRSGEVILDPDTGRGAIARAAALGIVATEPGGGLAPAFKRLLVRGESDVAPFAAGGIFDDRELERIFKVLGPSGGGVAQSTLPSVSAPSAGVFRASFPAAAFAPSQVRSADSDFSRELLDFVAARDARESDIYVNLELEGSLEGLVERINARTNPRRGSLRLNANKVY